MTGNGISGVKSAGIGLRFPHIQNLLEARPELPFVELLVDNWLYSGGLTAQQLGAVAEAYPVSLHGVGLSLGSLVPLDQAYLQAIKNLYQQTDALAYSEHLSFSQVDEQFMPDLLPLPYTTEALDHVCTRVLQVQDVLQQPMLIENVSSYIAFQEDDMTEAQFLGELLRRTDALLLLDVNNLYVNQLNLQRDALAALDQLPLERVAEIHLGGFSPLGECAIDAHNRPVDDAVWALYTEVIARIGPAATLIEWDNELPDLARLLAEKNKADAIIEQVAR